MSLSDEKKAFRKDIKKHMKVYSQDDLQKHSEIALKKLEQDPSFRSAKSVMLFWSLPDEVQTHAFIEKWSKEKIILLPAIYDDMLYPHIYESSEKMEIGAYQIAQPTNEIYKDDIDLVIVPGAAFDKVGHRLGRGKGYYDRFLTNYHGEKIGLCFIFQYTDYIPFETFDIPMDKIIAG